MVYQPKSIYNIYFIFFWFNLFLFISIIKTTYAATSTTPPNTGNYSLPTPQQPQPLVSFGQNIIDKGESQFFLDLDYLHAAQEQFQTYTSQFAYGISDSLVILLTIPFAANYESGFNHSSGISDISFMSEYAFFNNSNVRYTEQATVVVEITTPTGSYPKNPPTGNGSMSYLIGTTYNRLYVDWYWFVSPGMNLISPQENIHLGNQYLYQFGIGRNIKSQTNQYILFGLVEFDGEFAEKEKIMGSYNPDSGGNIIYMTPSLSFATETLMIQLGISLPVIQQLNGDQNKINYELGFNFIWTFY